MVRQMVAAAEAGRRSFGIAGMKPDAGPRVRVGWPRVPEERRVVRLGAGRPGVGGSAAARVLAGQAAVRV
ncbi:hypothetical protein [Nonomuraea sp. NPDC049141]|uniref:hypothetical protein n=1 Tax=unclassified Nonomuraea TaxID=2593643 RepID=UPI0033E6FB02